MTDNRLTTRLLQPVGVFLFTKPTCPFCLRAKKLLQEKEVVYTEQTVEGNPDAITEMVESSGRRTVPQVRRVGCPVGSCAARFVWPFGTLMNRRVLPLMPRCFRRHCARMCLLLPQGGCFAGRCVKPARAPL